MSTNTLQRIEQGEFFLMAGPCVVESEKLCLTIAEQLVKLTDKYKIPYVFKASYKKANRLSAQSCTGLGIDTGLSILQKVKTEFGVPIVTDIHETPEIPAVTQVADILQIPAFLCRQTDLLIAAAESGRIVNVKKGQFLAPWEMRNVVNKLEAAGGKELMLGTGPARQAARASEFGHRPSIISLQWHFKVRSS